MSEAVTEDRKHQLQRDVQEGTLCVHMLSRMSPLLPQESTTALK